VWRQSAGWMRLNPGCCADMKLKMYNGGDWGHQGGHLYVAATSVKDACNLVNEAYRKLKGYVDRPDIKILNLSYFNKYWVTGCWGKSMDGVVPERGVWWTPQSYGPERESVRRIL
jgi:hypothetical protein